MSKKVLEIALWQGIRSENGCALMDKLNDAAGELGVRSYGVI